MHPMLLMAISGSDGASAVVGTSLVGFFIVAIVGGFYFLPTLLALIRHKRNWLAIGALNLVLGWLLIPWVIALVWALTTDSQPQAPQIVVTNTSGSSHGSASTRPRSDDQDKSGWLKAN
jgi:hypothetical protein